MNKKNRIFTSLILFVVTAFALISSSYAWFSMITEVSANGINLSAQTPSNLLISDNENGDFVEQLSLDLTGIVLKHATTDDALEFKTSTHVDSAGAIVPDSEIIAATGKAEEGIPGYYFDLPLWFYNSGTATTENIVLSVANASDSTIEGEVDKPLYKAFRLAFIDDTTEPDTVITNEGKILWDSYKETSEDGIIPNQAKAFSNTDFKIFDSIAGEEKKKIVLRIWLEGYDSECLNINQEGSANIRLVFKKIE